MTQRDRVHAALIRAGAHGITGYDLGVRQPEDGGPRITRVAGRIHELRCDGVDIIKREKRRDGHDVYVLREALRPPVPADLPDNVLPLFTPAARAPRSPYDQDAA